MGLLMWTFLASNGALVRKLRPVNDFAGAQLIGPDVGKYFSDLAQIQRRRI
jgi:hypothetical protein